MQNPAQSLVPGTIYRLEGTIGTMERIHVDARFLGADGDNSKEIVWLFSMEWVEDNLQCSRIMRVQDADLRKLKVT